MWLLAGVAALVALGILVFYKEILAVACHRQVAAAVGIPATAVFYAILFATGMTVTACMPSVGGLLVYSLIIKSGRGRLPADLPAGLDVRPGRPDRGRKLPGRACFGLAHGRTGRGGNSGDVLRGPSWPARSSLLKKRRAQGSGAMIPTIRALFAEPVPLGRDRPRRMAGLGLSVLAHGLLVAGCLVAWPLSPGGDEPAPGGGGGGPGVVMIDLAGVALPGPAPGHPWGRDDPDGSEPLPREAEVADPPAPVLISESTARPARPQLVQVRPKAAKSQPKGARGRRGDLGPGCLDRYGKPRRHSRVHSGWWSGRVGNPGEPRGGSGIGPGGGPIRPWRS